MYVQQGNAFGCVGLCILWYNVTKINLFSALPFKKILMSVLYYLIMEFLCPASCTDPAIHACSIKVGSGILYYGMPRTPHTCIKQHAAALQGFASVQLLKLMESAGFVTKISNYMGTA